MERFLKAGILVAMGLFLASRLLNNTILFYINQRFVGLTAFAALGLAVVGVSLLRRSQAHDHPPDLHEHQARQGDNVEHADRDAHHHHHQHGAVSWLGLLIIISPLILGWLVPPQPLGASAIGNREVNLGGLTSMAAPSSDRRMGLVTGELNILDWLYIINQTADPADMNGSEARLIGFVYRDERFAADQFMVSRFILSCCVADATPAGLIVEWPDSATLEENQWVDISGQFRATSFNGITVPVLVVEEIKQVDPPSLPYLYG
jgi:uncharacterized repeat protein (TIGR03943 family)